MYTKIDHVGMAVRSLDQALRVYTDALGLHLERIEEVVDQGTRVAVLPIGESRLELLEAIGDSSPVARFIAKRGEGMHHICLQVEDIRQELSRLKEAGIRMIDETPRVGAGDCLVAFLHPSSTGGVLVELSQHQ
ncbi:MAG TPA: methylmalonyl-CoA epimerase [Acidobacteriota bacterium]|nr:methylmalonyl-CoA epimerase [Acidobacteriota bacterium]